MKNKTFLKFIFFVVLNLFFVSVCAQENKDNESYYNWFDLVTGKGNNALYNGVINKQVYRVFNNYHEFFLEDKFVLGNITYNGQMFYNIAMKYDLFADEIIVKIPSYSSFYFIRLISEKIDSFSIDKHLFINLLNKESNAANSFFELLEETSNITLLKKNLKTRFKVIDENQLFYKFKANEYYLLIYNNKNYVVSSKKDFRKIFPENKKAIIAFFRKNKNLYTSNRSSFFKKLVRMIDNKDINS